MMVAFAFLGGRKVRRFPCGSSFFHSVRLFFLLTAAFAAHTLSSHTLSLTGSGGAAVAAGASAHAVEQQISPELEAQLAELRDALASEDGDAVYRLTEGLRSEVPRKLLSAVVVKKKGVRSSREVAVGLLGRIRAKAATVGAIAKTRQLQAPSSVQRGASGGGGGGGSCIFDDQIFGLSSTSKEELKKQLDTPAMKETLRSRKMDGWFVCAYEGQGCACSGGGTVRYGNPHTHKYTKSVKAESVQCSVTVFGDPAPGEEKQCECQRSASWALERHLNSQSLLQEGWIFLLRALANSKLLPSTGDRAYHGMQLWSARGGGGCIEKYWIQKYLAEMRPYMPGGKCLEWGPGGTYAEYTPQCKQNYEVRYEEVKFGKRPEGLAGNFVYADILSFPRVLSAGPTKVRFGTIFATQLFEHLQDPQNAANALLQILDPGGVVVFTAPQQAQFHLVPGDYFRYTKLEVFELFKRAGFCVPPWTMAGNGDFIFDIARDAGLQVQDFTVEELDEGYQLGYDKISDGAITINALAFRPPHQACPNLPAPPI